MSHGNRAWDTNLLASLGGNDDMVAMDEKYHLKCLVNLQKHYHLLQRKEIQEPSNMNEMMNESREYMKKCVEDGKGMVV